MLVDLLSDSVGVDALWSDSVEVVPGSLNVSVELVPGVLNDSVELVVVPLVSVGR